MVKSGRYDEAAGPLLEAVATIERHLDKPTLNLEILGRALGLALLGRGDLSGGTRLIEQSLANVGTGHGQMPDWSAALDLLATARRLSGRAKEADELLDRACAGYMRSPGPSSITFIRCEAERTWIKAWRMPADTDAVAQWHQVVGRDWPGRLVVLH